MSTRTYPGTVTAVHDGDTLHVLADVGFYAFVRVDARLHGCNAAELATPAGVAARDHLATLAVLGSSVTVICYGPDKYGGRWTCDVITAAGVNLSPRMIADGYAAAWDGLHAPAPVPPWPIPVVSHQ